MTVWQDYAELHQAMVDANELDPIYPLLKEIARLLNLNKDEAAWLCHVYVAYYDFGSGLTCYDQVRSPAVPSEDLLKLPCDTERRNHRTPSKLKQHFESIVSIAENNGGLHTWLSKYIRDTPQQSWKAMLNPLETIYGNGRWASYKLVEMIGFVCDLPVEAPDMGHANSTGPRAGLNYLYSGLPSGNKPSEIAYLDKVSLNLIDKLAEQGVQTRLQEAETSLCALKSLIKGTYYIGEDLDAMLEEIKRQPNGLTELALEARSNVFPHRYLGEKMGWEGVDKARLKAYKETGKILIR